LFSCWFHGIIDVRALAIVIEVFGVRFGTFTGFEDKHPAVLLARTMGFPKPTCRTSICHHYKFIHVHTIAYITQMSKSICRKIRLNKNFVNLLDTVLSHKASLVIDIDVAMLLNHQPKISHGVALGPEIRPVFHSTRVCNQEVNSIHTDTIAYLSDLSKTF
jgi:hypothetical protein